MDPDTLLERLCRRHAVPEAFGARLRPLVVRAGQARPELRERILAMIERSFVEEAARRQSAQTAARSDPGTGSLEMLARVLHRWQLPRFGAETEGE